MAPVETDSSRAETIAFPPDDLLGALQDDVDLHAALAVGQRRAYFHGLARLAQRADENNKRVTARPQLRELEFAAQGPCVGIERRGGAVQAHQDNRACGQGLALFGENLAAQFQVSGGRLRDGGRARRNQPARSGETGSQAGNQQAASQASCSSHGLFPRIYYASL